MIVDIAFSINKKIYLSLLVALNSILKNSKLDPDHPLRFNIAVPPGDRAFFEAQIHSAFAGLYPEYGPEAELFRVREFFPSAYLDNYISLKFDEADLERQKSRRMQYGRLYLNDIFPDTRRIIYLDTDILVLGDIRELFAKGDQFTAERYVAAIPHLFPAMFYAKNVFKLWNDLRQIKNTFNGGVFMTDFCFWTDKTAQIRQHYLELDAANGHDLLHLDDEAMLNLMFKNYIQLGIEWNAWGYGQPHFMVKFLRRSLDRIKIIHWSGGHHKPWESDRVIYASLWKSYLPPTASPRPVDAAGIMS